MFACKTNPRKNGKFQQIYELEQFLAKSKNVNVLFKGGDIFIFYHALFFHLHKTTKHTTKTFVEIQAAMLDNPNNDNLLYQFTA
jgi:hypothetical protein